MRIIKNIKYVDLFSGIGGVTESFHQLKKEGILDFNLYKYCEYDDKIAKMFSIIHNEDLSKNLGDITLVNESKLDDFDCIFFGFPCQDISTLGSQKGLFDSNGNKTRSGLFFDAMRIIKEKQPKIAIAENVKALLFKKNESDFNAMEKEINNCGYNLYYKVFTPKDFNIPHSRQRIFMVLIRKDIDDSKYEFPVGIGLHSTVKDFLDVDIKQEYYLNETQIDKYAKNKMRLQKKYSSLNSDIAVCMTTKQGIKSNSQNFIEDELGVRMLTPREMFKLQGFDFTHGDTLINSGYNINNIGFVIGNSLCVSIMKELIKSILKYI